jgi:hypothetical protein
MAQRYITVDAVSGFLTGYLVVALYDPSALSTPVAYQVFQRPTQNPGKVIFNNVDDIVYRVIIWQNTTPTPGGTRVAYYDFDEKFSASTSGRDDLPLIAGVTAGMTVGANSYSDASLANWKYSVERKGEGTLVWGQDITLNQAGGWSLTDTNYQFGQGEVYIIHFQAISVGTTSSSISSGKLFNDTLLVTNDTTLDSTTHMGKFVLLQGVGDLLTITLPPASSVPNSKLIAFLSDGGSHKAVTIKANGSDDIKYMNQDNDFLQLLQGEQLWMYYDGSAWRVAYDGTEMRNVGESVYHEVPSSLNTLQCAGQLLSKTTYARLWKFISQKIDTADLVSESTWNYKDPITNEYINHGKFCNYDNNYFRLPIRYMELDTNGYVVGGTGFLRGIKGDTTKPGAYTRDGVGIFNTDITGKPVQYHWSSAISERSIALGKAAESTMPDYGNVSVLNIPFSGRDRFSNVSIKETHPAYTSIYINIRF